MRQLHSTTRMSLIIALLLVVNAVCIFAYRDAVLSCENKKDSMLNFTIRYETLAGSLRSDAAMYRNTNDPVYLAAFDSSMEKYISGDGMNSGYLAATATHSPEGLTTPKKDQLIPLGTQLDSLEMTEKEQALYTQFSKEYSKLLGYLREGRESNDFAILHTAEFESAYDAQISTMSELKKQYIERLYRQERRIVSNQNTMELTLIFLSMLLFFITTFTFGLLKRKNAYNSYFRKLYTTIVENINAGLCIVNESGKYEYMNPQYLNMLDIQDANYQGKTAEELCPPQISKLLNTFEEFAAEGSLNLEIRDKPVHMDYSHFIIFDENNQKKYIDLIHDRTETEEMQQQLRNQLREIELYSHAKDAFLANISHEIKTPINAIVGMTYFLKQSELTEKQQDIIGKIETSSDVLLSIINDVLDFSKIKAHSLNLCPSAFYLDDLLKGLEDMFVSQIQAKGLSFEGRYAVPAHLALYTDRTRLLQIFVNLLGNACKFTESGRISLTARTTEETNDSVNLEFCVEDTGIGIEKNDISRLFLAFEQIENHLTKRHEGTGLGLSICKHIVEAMGGALWVDSIPKLGSKFYFSLPCQKATEEQLTSTLASPSCGTVRLDGHGAHVLIAEDTEINMEIVTKLLEDANIVCHQAKNGEEAVELCKRHADNFFRLILMDIHMPVMDGYTASKVIKKDLQIDTPILALTATSMEEAASQQNSALIDGYILKPFKIEKFYETLQSFFPQSDLPYGGSEEAIHNLGGMKSLYFKHVARFKTGYADSVRQIRDLLQAQDYVEAKRAAHTVKGLAGTLGMPVLHEAASILVADIVSHSPDLENSIERFDTALQGVLESEPSGFQIHPVA